MDPNTQLQAAIELSLPAVVREATGRPAFTIANWSIDQLTGGATGAGVYRLSDAGRDTAKLVVICSGVGRERSP